jgi:orotate phosphoribosyltransferase
MSKPLMFRTYAQLAQDIREWSRRLPEDIIAVAGSGRSGMIVASMLMAERNIHLLSTDELLSGSKPWLSSKRRACHAKFAKDGGRILVVDDTVCGGGQIQTERQRLGRESREMTGDVVPIQYAVVYAMEQSKHIVDHYFLNVGDIDHVFEWNWHHHWFLENTLVDMDGVLCEDWPFTYETGDKADEYMRHLETTKPLMKPSFEIGEIVTGRLEKYRPQTEAWLAKHGIRYKSLNMCPCNTPEQRDLNGGSATRKARVYMDRPNAMMFAESCQHQAEVIAKITGRPVLSYQEMKFYNGAL